MNELEKIYKVKAARDDFRKRLGKQGGNISDAVKEKLLSFDGMSEDKFYKLITGVNKDDLPKNKVTVLNVLYQLYNLGSEDPWAQDTK